MASWGTAWRHRTRSSKWRVEFWTWPPGTCASMTGRRIDAFHDPHLILYAIQLLMAFSTRRPKSRQVRLVLVVPRIFFHALEAAHGEAPRDQLISSRRGTRPSIMLPSQSSKPSGSGHPYCSWMPSSTPAAYALKTAAIIRGLLTHYHPSSRQDGFVYRSRYSS